MVGRPFSSSGSLRRLSKPASPPVQRFELPILEFELSSLTEGTNIPPPQPSPAKAPVSEVPTPPKTPSLEQEVRSKPLRDSLNGQAEVLEHSPASDITSSSVNLKRRAVESPVSPTFSTRSSSLRRLLSKPWLNGNSEEHQQYANGGPGHSMTRPMSQQIGNAAQHKKAKRSSGWFKRLRHGNMDSPPRSSMQVDEAKTFAGPPPPVIPEMSKWESKVDTNIGDDLFKGIK